MIRVELSRPDHWESVGTLWRSHETEFACSFFQSWTWMGCLVGARFPDPVLLRAFDGDRLVALALFNRRSRSLFLGETGEPVMDSLTIEHNGILMPPGAPPGTLRACLQGVRAAARRVILGGTDAAHAETAATLGPAESFRRPAPFVDLTALRTEGQLYLDALSANTRYQLRRSERRYAQSGPIVARRADSVGEAQGFLDALMEHHQARWTAEGKPGAFAAPSVRLFHRTLVSEGFPRGEIDVWHVSAGRQDIGYLYNFRHGGRVLAYQSGLAADGDAHRKPGLTCHRHAIEAALRDGLSTYDFLAGDHRYKQSLATGTTTLYWTTCLRRGSTAWARWAARRVLRRLKARLAKLS